MIQDSAPFDPEESWAILIGSTDYLDPKLSNIPAVKNNLTELARLLTDQAVAGLPESHVITIRNPSAPVEVIRRLREVGDRATGLLLVYFAGHGLLDEANLLHLAVSTSTADDPDVDAIRYVTLASRIRHTVARRRVLLLDCCFSGLATNTGLSDPISLVVGQLASSGTWVLTASPPDMPAMARPGEQFTAFTGELIDLLRNGLIDAGPYLRPEDIYLEMSRRLHEKNLPLPRQQGSGGFSNLLFMRNRAHHDEAPEASDASSTLPAVQARHSESASASTGLGDRGPTTADDLIRTTTMKQQVGIDLGSALRSFIVRATLPETLAQLRELAYNLRWSWDRRTRDLFRSVDPHLWDVAYHDPVRLLTLVRPTRLDELAAEPAFIDLLGEMHADLTQYLEKPRWFESQAHSPLRSVAYFSAEFGITEALPQYSGGLGVVAGDHIKAASSLGIPLVGVGLMYRMGYFRQHVNQEGLQEEHYPVLEPHFLAADLVDDIRISLRLAGHDVDAQIWQIHVGRVKLYLLDADLDSNDEEFRAVTDRLFGGGSEHRLRQAILLGMGGVQALRAVGVETDVFHTNEGHAGFLGLERMHNLITQEKLSWHEAIEAVRAETAFTTYAPVPAGVDRFPRELMERYFSEWAEECGVSIDTLMSLGHFPGEEPSDPFNMAVMGLRLADKAIAVSKLHAQTSRAMFHSLWPAVTGVETPIISITNGVHGRTWVSSQIEDLYSNFVSPDWDDAGPNEWARIADAPDDEIWNIRQKGREALVNFVRARLRASLSNREELGVADRWVDEVLDPRFLIIGFARRFATYKRASLLLSQPDRLRSLLLNDEQPVQLVFAGKAHPADDLGKEIISQIIRYSTDLAVRHRIVYLEDYDISVARMLYQGSDVWLNTPRRPMEACGTSGQKAALNGALNVSILDGWWDEMFDGANGWAIASAESVTDLVQRDDFEANNLFETLEREVIPLFYDRRGMTYPSQWVRMIKSSIKSLAPRVEASRMVREYLSEVYEPLARRSDLLAADDYRRARELSAWKKAVLSAWPRVAVVSVEDSVEIGNDRHVTAEVFLAGLRPEDVSVQVLHGPLANDGGIIGAEAVPLSPHAPTKTGADVWEYKGSFRYQRFGRYGYELRVVPAHPDLGSPFELGLTTWS